MFLKMNKSSIGNHITQKMKIKFMFSIANHIMNKADSVKCCIKALKQTR